MNTRTGGPAFPVPIASSASGSVKHASDEGMSLRDYFAAQAMNAVIASSLANERAAEAVARHMEKSGRTCYEAIAVDSYEYADAMLKARSDATGDRP